MDIYIHPGINKGGIHRKHISFLWVRREGHNEQSISFTITPPPPPPPPPSVKKKSGGAVSGSRRIR